MSIKRSKPTRRDLLIVINQIGMRIRRANAFALNDRDPNRLVNLERELVKASNLVFDSLQFDPPMDGKKSKKGWGEV